MNKKLDFVIKYILIPILIFVSGFLIGFRINNKEIDQDTLEDETTNNDVVDASYQKIENKDDVIIDFEEGVGLFEDIWNCE